jgi:hypothetical protein
MTGAYTHSSLLSSQLQEMGSPWNLLQTIVTSYWLQYVPLRYRYGYLTTSNHSSRSNNVVPQTPYSKTLLVMYIEYLMPFEPG